MTPRSNQPSSQSESLPIRALHDVQFLITAHRDLQEVLRAIVLTTRDAFDARECTIRLAETDESGRLQMRLAAWSGRPPTERRVWVVRRGSIDSRVMAGETVAIEDLFADGSVRDQRTLKRRGLKSLLTAPMRIGDQIIGGLRVFMGECRTFSAEEVALLESLAGQAAIAIENGRLYHALATAHAELTRSYEELRSTQAELVRQTKLAALGEMAALVAHEIRNPLTAIRGFAQRIQRRIADDHPAQSQGCQIIIDEVDRLNKVVVDVLDFARHLEPRVDTLSLNQLVQDIITLESHTLQERGIQVSANCAHNMHPIPIDSGQIRQVLLNLVANARQAMTHGGQLTIRTHRPEPGWQAIDIIDNGPGIPEEMRQKIFTPFFTTKMRGTGLGLTLSQRIVEDHGGRLTLEPHEGSGTTFRIWLPEGETQDRPE